VDPAEAAATAKDEADDLRQMGSLVSSD